MPTTLALPISWTTTTPFRVTYPPVTRITSGPEPSAVHAGVTDQLNGVSVGTSEVVPSSHAARAVGAPNPPSAGAKSSALATMVAAPIVNPNLIIAILRLGSGPGRTLESSPWHVQRASCGVSSAGEFGPA